MPVKRWLLCAGLALSLLPASSDATVILTFEGTTPDTLVDVRFEAALTISGDNLTIVLTNDSLNHSNGASHSRNPNDLLTSFYFDIFDGVSRPTLTYTGATGDVCLFENAAADDCTVTQEPGDGSDEADLRALVADDDGWQFKSGLTLSPGADTLTFGIGTAGNNSLSPNGFNGNIVDGLDYGIFAGTTGTATEGGAPSLDGSYLVHNVATFTFTGVSGFDEGDIGDEVLFGLGTQPDSTGLVPEPGSLGLLGVGVLGLAYQGRRSKRA
jgi:hypothetical protein